MAKDEVVLWGFRDPIRVSRAAMKRVKQLQEDGAINQVAIVVQEKNALRLLEAKEREAYRRAEQRINGGYDLATQATHRATYLHHLITHAADRSPGHELTLRGVEETAALGANSVIFKYMTG